MFEAACNGDYEESHSGRIEIKAPTASVNTINRMLDYLYLQEYDVGSLDGSVVLPDDTLAATSATCFSFTLDESDQTTPPLDNEQNEDASEAKIADHTEHESHKLRPWAKRAIAHIHLYSIADYYQISDLKDAALMNLEKALQDGSPQDFEEVVIEVSILLS